MSPGSVVTKLAGAAGLAAWQAAVTSGASRAPVAEFRGTRDLSPLPENRGLRARVEVSTYGYWIGWFGLACFLGYGLAPALD